MIFSDAEREYLAGQLLGRIATAQPDGTLQVSPVGFRYNSGTDTIDIAGHGMAKSRKFRNVADNGRVAFVIDDLASTDPWRPRFLEIRGHAEAITEPTDSAYADFTGGFDGAIIRIHPERLISFGVNSPADVQRPVISARNVG
ncbi:PPOX class F420-dependent oxidoreductase [Nocardia sp. CA-119907]|uniref:PPOX class F420-dependent oxidoreductase n=1 Tax=Nocardia sp. CA-119907 TaxID=3239973 RepID=UPI003D95292B